MAENKIKLFLLLKFHWTGSAGRSSAPQGHSGIWSLSILFWHYFGCCSHSQVNTSWHPATSTYQPMERVWKLPTLFLLPCHSPGLGCVATFCEGKLEHVISNQTDMIRNYMLFYWSHTTYTILVYFAFIILAIMSHAINKYSWTSSLITTWWFYR